MLNGKNPLSLTKVICRQSPRYLVLIPDDPNSVSKFYLQIAEKKNLQQRFFHYCSVKRGPLGRFAKLTRWLEPRALVEKNQTSPLPYDFCRGAVDCVFKTVISTIN